MRKLIAHCDNSKSIGTDACIAFIVEDDATEEDINEYAWELALDQASSYWEVIDTDSDDDTMEAYEEDPESYILTEDVEVAWEDYSPEKHDMFRAGGGSFEEDFARMS